MSKTRTVDMKHPDNMSRGEKLKMLKFIHDSEGGSAALRFWLNHCPRISRKAFEDACK